MPVYTLWRQFHSVNVDKVVNKKWFHFFNFVTKTITAHSISIPEKLKRRKKLNNYWLLLNQTGYKN